MSGLVHQFDLLASGKGRKILVAARCASPRHLLIELAKALDVDEEVLILFRGSLPSDFKEITEGRVKVITFETPSELESKLKQLLRVTATSSSAVEAAA